MLENGVIEKSNSPYAFNIVVIRKKNRVEEGIRVGKSPNRF